MARSDMASSRVIAFQFALSLPMAMPMSAAAAYTMGTAWPSLSTRRSLLGCEGFAGSYRMCWYISTATTCARLAAVVGWPEPEAAVIS